MTTDRHACEATLVANLEWLRRVAGALCRRHGITAGDDVEDFASWMIVRLLDHWDLSTAEQSAIEAAARAAPEVHKHAAGAPIFAQLMHAGAISQGNSHDAGPIAPSAIAPIGQMLEEYGGSGRWPVPREMTLADLESVIAGFAAAATRARASGFDGVEVHGANGYLLDQFLTVYTNSRTDDYGGSVQNRIRLTAGRFEASIAPDTVARLKAMPADALRTLESELAAASSAGDVAHAVGAAVERAQEAARLANAESPGADLFLPG